MRHLRIEEDSKREKLDDHDTEKAIMVHGESFKNHKNKQESLLSRQMVPRRSLKENVFTIRSLTTLL